MKFRESLLGIWLASMPLTLLFLAVMLFALAVFGPSARGQEIVRSGCYGWLISAPGSCGEEPALVQYSLCMRRVGTDCAFWWRAHSPVGACLGIGAGMWERMVEHEVWWRCLYLDGRAPTDLTLLGNPTLGMNNGRCE